MKLFYFLRALLFRLELRTADRDFGADSPGTYPWTKQRVVERGEPAGPAANEPTATTCIRRVTEHYIRLNCHLSTLSHLDYFETSRKMTGCHDLADYWPVSWRQA
jgi:hypothetical protein